MYDEQRENTPVVTKPKRDRRTTRGFILGIVFSAVFLAGVFFSSSFFGFFDRTSNQPTIVEVFAEESITWLADMVWFTASPQSTCSQWWCVNVVGSNRCEHVNGWIRDGNWCPSRMDNAGNVHYGGIFAGRNDTFIDNNHSITYLLNGNYTRFTGSVVLSHTAREAVRSYRIKIYADNTRIFTSPIMTGGVVPAPFDLCVVGIEQIRIVRVADGSAEIGVVNAALHRVG